MSHTGFKSVFTVIALIGAIMLPCAFTGKAGGRGKQTSWEDGADARKADYIYMEAMRNSVLNKDDAFFELLRRSQELDSTDTQPGSNLGFYLMALSGKDSIMAVKGFNLMRRHFDKNPDDYYGSIFYGMVNNRLGNTFEAVRVWETLDSLNPNKPDVALRYADALQSTGDSVNLRRSVDVLNRIERAEGKSLGLTSHKVRSLMALGDTVATYSEMRTLLNESGRNASNSIYAGDLFMALQQPDSAILYYNRACEIDPSNGLAYYKRAEFYRERGDSIGYNSEVIKAVQQDGLEPDVKLEILSSYISQNYSDTLQRAQISSLFENLLLQYPHETSVRDLFSSYLIAVSDLKAAAEQQEYALDIDPSNANRWRSTISLYVQAGDLKKALAIGKRAMHYLPDDATLTFYTSMVLSQLEMNDEAMDMLKKALEQTTEADVHLRSDILCTIGDNLYKVGSVDSAFVYYERALEANPENLLALNNCAYFMAEQGIDLDRAETMCAICVRQEPENDTALDTYAWIYFKKKNYAEAKKMIDRALEIEGENPQSDVLHHAGDIYYMNGDPVAALEFWKTALELDPDNALLQKKVKNKTHYYE